MIITWKALGWTVRFPLYWWSQLATVWRLPLVEGSPALGTWWAESCVSNASQQRLNQTDPTAAAHFKKSCSSWFHWDSGVSWQSCCRANMQTACLSHHPSLATVPASFSSASPPYSGRLNAPQSFSRCVAVHSDWGFRRLVVDRATVRHFSLLLEVTSQS